MINKKNFFPQKTQFYNWQSMALFLKFKTGYLIIYIKKTKGKQMTRKVLLCVLLLSVAVTAQNFIRNGTYLIISAVNNKVLDVQGAGKKDGTNICVHEHLGNPNQEFKVSFDNSGICSIVSLDTKKHVNVDGGSLKDLANINQWASNNSDAQKFIIEPVTGTDMFVIVAVHSGKALTVDPNSNNVIQMPKPQSNDAKDANLNQYWRFSQRVSFKNMSNNKMFDIRGASDDTGAKLITFENNNKKNQAFDLIPIVNSEDYFLRCVHSGKYLSVSDGHLVSGSQIVQLPFGIVTPQRFKLDLVSDFTYYIASSKSNLVLDGAGKEGIVALADKKPVSSQQWKMYMFNPKSTTQQLKEELKETGSKTIDKLKNNTKKAKDKIKKLFK